LEHSLERRSFHTQRYYGETDRKRLIQYGIFVSFLGTGDLPGTPCHFSSFLSWPLAGIFSLERGGERLRKSRSS
jgi:hypothetical protein